MLSPAIGVLLVLYVGALVFAGLQSFGYAPLYDPESLKPRS